MMTLKLALKASVATNFYIATYRNSNRMHFVRQTLKTLNVKRRNMPDKADIWYLETPIEPDESVKTDENEHQ